LHEAARAIVDRHGGRVPDDPAELRSLPGVGPYTAAAVASIAYGVPVAAVDTNVRRVVARAALGSEPDDVARAAIDDAASAWLAPDEPGAWNQAVMDLGRFVCRPVPRCQTCPLRPACRSVRAGPPRPMSRDDGSRNPFEGSRRQLRGRVVERLRSMPSARVGGLARDLGPR
jgi:A/G-specific adenine glycosylase